ncbi:MAG: hypothetical protein ACM32I_04175 [Nitrospirota bacterium]
MESYRYQQLAYLIVPLTAGFEFFVTARTDRRTSGKESTGAVIMDVLGYVFVGIIPALFLFTIYTLENHRLPLLAQLLHRLDRYGVMFFFLGSWWQVFLITSLRARRASAGNEKLLAKVWLPYLAFGAFISALILWVAPWNLMWVSIFWFVGTFALFAVIGVSSSKISKIFLALAILVLICENIFFIILDAIV